ncbi:Uncharacterised protein [Bordetella pertussis]|nr:Uncharacterised protein [Bordetella pertussis]
MARRIGQRKRAGREQAPAPPGHTLLRAPDAKTPGAVRRPGVRTAMAPGGLCPPGVCRCLAQQRQDVLRDLVGLGQDRGASLLQDLVLGHVRHFGRVVRIFDARTGSR